MYEVIIEQPVQRFIKRLPQEEQKKLLNALEQLAEHPFLGKELVGTLKGLHSWRVGAYRIIYKIEPTHVAVYVVRIGHRKNVYE